MTLRQQYARPTPRAIARHWAGPPLSLTPASPGSAHCVTLASARTSRSHPAPKGQPRPALRPGRNSARSRGPATG
jgi:hypothetical protein